MAASNRYGSGDPETERTVMINIQKEEQHKCTYRLLSVAAIGIWIIVSVVILVKPSLFREQEGYYLYDDRILYYQDYRWYEILRKKKEYGVIKFHLQISGTKSRISEKFHWLESGWNNSIFCSTIVR